MIWLAGAVLVLHLALAGRYDLFRDELYYIVCGRHLAYGYVDQPPLVPLMAATLYRSELGAWSLRLPAAIAAAALVWLGARFARLLGGGPLAATFAALACTVAPMLMGLTATLNTSSFEPLCWTAIAFLLIRAFRTEDDRAFMIAGCVAGLALELKYSVAFWLVGLALGLLLTPQRCVFRRRSLWLGIGLATVIALPSFAWQAAHRFPFLELIAAAKAKNTAIPLVQFWTNQIRVMNPLTAPLWVAGLIAPIIVRRLRDLRCITIGTIFVMVIVRLGHGKDYYLAPLYPTLFAIGAVALAPIVRGLAGKATAGLAVVAAVLMGIIAAPIALPILTPEGLVRYMHALAIAPQKQERSFEGTILPEEFADQLGWRAFTAQTTAAWRHIPIQDRAGTAILVDNYGEAAALDVYGRDLPPTLSGHNQYFMWGLRGMQPRDLLVIHRGVTSVRPFCREVVSLGITGSRFAMGFENGKDIVLCRGLHPSLTTVWPRLKSYD